MDAPTRPRTFARPALASVFATAGVIAALTFVAAGPASAATAPGLGTVASYSVLGGQAVTNTGVTNLSGDLGVSPGTAVTGFPPGIVSGATHKADAQASQAQTDLTTAYNATAAEAPDASVSGDMVGTTKVAGVYHSSGPLALSGTLTLDAQGDPNSVFVFQVASTLITASASYVNLVNGAQACNVFWQVGSSATLGTNSVFRGTIMALTSVTVTTGTVVQGRALARNGSVTLDHNTFTPATCGQPSQATATTTRLSASPNPATTGASTTLTATVAAGGSHPTGTVTFYSGTTALGTTTVSSTGTATLTISAGAAARTRTVTARYNGNLSSGPSNSAAVSLIVRRAAAAPAAPVATPTTRAVAAPIPVAPTGTAVVPTGTTVLLAATGAGPVLGLTGLGAGLLVLGVVLSWLTRSSGPAGLVRHRPAAALARHRL